MAVTIEKTGKGWKLLMLIGMLVGFSGCVTCATGHGEASAWCWILGASGFIAGKLGGWWFHG